MWLVITASPSKHYWWGETWRSPAPLLPKIFPIHSLIRCVRPGWVFCRSGSWLPQWLLHYIFPKRTDYVLLLIIIAKQTVGNDKCAEQLEVTQPTHGIFRNFFEQCPRPIEYKLWGFGRNRRHSGYLSISSMSKNSNLISHVIFTITLPTKKIWLFPFSLGKHRTVQECPAALAPAYADELSYLWHQKLINHRKCTYFSPSLIDT